MHQIVSIIIAPVCLIHLWLHALLTWWKRCPYVFYALSGLSWVLAWKAIEIIEPISRIIFAPSFVIEKIGLSLMAIGLAGVILSLVSLGPKRFFMWAVFKPESVSQKRITGGIFKFVPHPAYIGYILVALGNFLSSGQFYILIIFLTAIILMPIVIWLEEHELEKRV